MIDATNLHKSYGQIQALRDVSFEIAEGEIVGLLGPNGAGKTTIIKILTGYLQPDSGRVMVDGLDVLTQTRKAQERIGYLPENAPLYPELTVQGYLQMMAQLRQIPDEEELDRLEEAVLSTGLLDHLTRPIGELSKGFRQRVGLAQAILHWPRLIILDEPTIGLDPTQLIEIRNLIKRLAGHSTVLFSTHILPEVEAICDRVIMLFNGEVKVNSHLSELTSTNAALLTVDGPGEGVESALAQLEGVKHIEMLTSKHDPAPRSGGPRIGGPSSYRIQGEEDVDLCPAIYWLASKQEWPVRELRQEIQTLESVFNKLAVAE
jgi:ABC-2 type transport system ATP-binding protein